MKSRHVKRKERGRYPATHGKSLEYITCPACGWEMELWSEGAEITRCQFCGHKFFKRETTVH